MPCARPLDRRRPSRAAKRRAREFGLPFREIFNRATRAGLGEATRPRSSAVPKTILHPFVLRLGIGPDKLNQLADELDTEDYAAAAGKRRDPD